MELVGAVISGILPPIVVGGQGVLAESHPCPHRVGVTRKEGTMKNWIMNFIADERGAETTELSVTGVVVAGGAVSGFLSLKEAIKTKQDEVIGKLDDAAAT